MAELNPERALRAVGELLAYEGEEASVGLASRYDLIFFKLYAAADDVGPGSVHYQDLIALEPTQEELRAAASWIGSQDASPAFRGIVDEVVRRVRMDLGIDA